MAPVSPSLTSVLDSMGNINLTLGATVIFAVLNGIMFGITSAQTLVYFNAPRKDTAVMKWAIFILWLVDLLETILYTHSAYQYTVTALINPVLFYTFVWSSGAYVIAGSFSLALIDVIFTYRVWIFSRSSWPWLINGSLAVTSFVSTVVFVQHSFTTPNELVFGQRFKALGFVSAISQAVSDVSIMISVCYVLFRSHTQFKRHVTSSIVNKLIFFSINTCLLSCVIIVLVIVIQQLVPQSSIWQGFIVLHPKCMLNSLLALLNSRDHMRNKMLSDEVVSIQLAHVSQDRGIPNSATSGDRSISGRNIQMDMDVFGSHKVSHDKVTASSELSEPVE
ncbi:hypothetical protein BC629DRAFT_1590207 [Irpex lacteus]|nr:hypothetical protein BC629DRAFT_1590207 [Irpex lacteus]